MHVEAALTFAATLPTLLVAHNVGDHWVQTGDQAARKGRPGWRGRWACGVHVVSYTAVTALAVLLVTWLFALPVGPIGFVAGQAVSAVTHYWADRRTPLAWLAGVVGKGEFWSVGTGAYALDQSWHWLWLLVAAIVTAVA